MVPIIRMLHREGHPIEEPKLEVLVRVICAMVHHHRKHLRLQQPGEQRSTGRLRVGQVGTSVEALANDVVADGARVPPDQAVMIPLRFSIRRLGASLVCICFLLLPSAPRPKAEGKAEALGLSPAIRLRLGTRARAPAVKEDLRAPLWLQPDFLEVRHLHHDCGLGMQHVPLKVPQAPAHKDQERLSDLQARHLRIRVRCASLTNAGREIRGQRELKRGFVGVQGGDHLRVEGLDVDVALHRSLPVRRTPVCGTVRAPAPRLRLIVIRPRPEPPKSRWRGWLRDSRVGPVRSIGAILAVDDPRKGHQQLLQRPGGEKLHVSVNFGHGLHVGLHAAHVPVRDHMDIVVVEVHHEELLLGGQEVEELGILRVDLGRLRDPKDVAPNRRFQELVQGLRQPGNVRAAPLEREDEAPERLDHLQQQLRALAQEEDAVLGQDQREHSHDGTQPKALERSLEVQVHHGQRGQGRELEPDRLENGHFALVLQRHVQHHAELAASHHRHRDVSDKRSEVSLQWGPRPAHADEVDLSQEALKAPVERLQAHDADRSRREELDAIRELHIMNGR
mmetsp:Transcript_8064/g.30273  ORF Transcript_8064/g.30273 Transcript_8064/m.30273 type:complete len:563 (+) Transcript_8064:1546-3234(+)